MPAAVPNTGATAQKNTHTAVVPMRAPISGRSSSRWIGPRNAKRSSAVGRTGSAGGVLTSVTVATVSSGW